MEVVFSFVFSSTIISDFNKDGPIGDVFALLTWLIAIGVVIILGAVAGIVWDERHLSLLAPARALMARVPPAVRHGTGTGLDGSDAETIAAAPADPAADGRP